MSSAPLEIEGIRICIMRDPRIYNRRLREFEREYGRPMYDLSLKALAPSTDLKNGFKRKVISWEEYVPKFGREVLRKQKELIAFLAQVAMSQNITLLCGEKTPDRCHRRLVAEECKKYQPRLEVIIQ